MLTTLGIISDTHGLVRKEALDALVGVDSIIHAGDVGACEVIEALEQIAPVFAVRGNFDTQQWARGLQAARTVEVERARIYVVHSVADLDFDPAGRGYHAVISGHSHRALEEVRKGVLYLNPGSAGPRRFRLPVTVARLGVDGTRLKPQIITLLS